MSIMQVSPGLRIMPEWHGLGIAFRAEVAFICKFFVIAVPRTNSRYAICDIHNDAILPIISAARTIRHFMVLVPVLQMPAPRIAHRCATIRHIASRPQHARRWW